MTYRFPLVTLLTLLCLAFTAQAGDHATQPLQGESVGAVRDDDLAGQRRRAALRAALLAQQAQQVRDGQKQGGSAEAERHWTPQDRAELRQQIRQQSRSNSRP